MYKHTHTYTHTHTHTHTHKHTHTNTQTHTHTHTHRKNTPGLAEAFKLFANNVFLMCSESDPNTHIASIQQGWQRRSNPSQALSSLSAYVTSKHEHELRPSWYKFSKVLYIRPRYPHTSLQKRARTEAKLENIF